MGKAPANKRTAARASRARRGTPREARALLFDPWFGEIAAQVRDKLPFSVEVEDRLMSHPAVAECAVIGLPDDTWGEKVTAAVVRATGAQVSGEELIAHCRENLAGFKTPKRVIWMDEPLPRTPTGKVKKFILVEKYS